MLFLVSQGPKSYLACPRGFKVPCPRVLVADGKVSHGCPSLVNTYVRPKGLTQFSRAVVWGLKFVIFRGCKPIKWNSPMPNDCCAVCAASQGCLAVFKMKVQFQC